MKRVLRSELTIAALFVLWTAITAVRAIFTRPPQPAWIVGTCATAACMVCIGWIAHGLYQQR